MNLYENYLLKNLLLNKNKKLKNIKIFFFKKIKIISFCNNKLKN